MTVSERLEQVRLAEGVPSVRRFVGRMIEAGEAVSYPAAKTYHAGRDPSLAYLAAVVRVYNAPARWLLTGGNEEDGCADCWRREQVIIRAIKTLVQADDS